MRAAVAKESFQFSLRAQGTALRGCPHIFGVDMSKIDHDALNAKLKGLQGNPHHDGISAKKARKQKKRLDNWKKLVETPET